MFGIRPIKDRLKKTECFHADARPIRVGRVLIKCPRARVSAMPDAPSPKAKSHPFKRGDGIALPRRGEKDTKGRHRPRRAAYAELAITSNFTFLTGASHPDELTLQAAEIGHHAVAITDVNSLAGVVRAHVAAKEAGIPLIVGCRLKFTHPIGADEPSGMSEPGFSIFVYPTNRAAYGRLCTLLTIGKRRAPKGSCYLRLDDLFDHQEGLLAVASFDGPIAPDADEQLRRLRSIFDADRLSLAATRLYAADDDARIRSLHELSQQTRVPLAAVNDVHYHKPHRRPLQDVLTCIRSGCTLAGAGFRLFPNGERYLKTPDEMLHLFAAYPKAVARTIEIADRARNFSLDQLRYEYADEVVPPGMTPMVYLRELTWQGARDRYPRGIPQKVRNEIEHEFELIDELNYAPYFLTVHDIVKFARSRGILCQGRGAAANSAVCYCLGVTAVDPARIDVLFERFVSRERAEPPDIDIDFEHERREEVIQYIYAKYGRDRAGLTAEVISYRGRSAVRDIGKALGLSLDAVDRLAKRISHWAHSVFEDGDDGPRELRDIGFNPDDPTLRILISLSRQIMGFPRHLSQHVGGFVITRGPLCEFVPIENAAMEGRTIIEWDKDDIDAMGMLKVDCLGLGMLTCIRKAMEMVSPALQLHQIPPEDPRVYDTICDADTVGVFQIESRAQMSMLPRLKPRCFYDLVIEIAIVRPGPIVGNMVHPYLRRRNGEEPATYPDDKVRAVLAKTLGIPLFQEQAMALAIVAAGFTPGEAELLRRAITAWKSRDSIARYMTRFIEGMVNRGYERHFAEQCFERLKGFSEYGFPESHAASFALLVYASSWLKCHHPAAFAAALINSQPMGFYAPAQIIRDAREHGVATRPVDVNHSEWDCTLENGGREIRLGMRLVKGLREEDAHAMAAARRRRGPFSDIGVLWRASDVNSASLRILALADAFGSMGLDRQHALWQVQAIHGKPLPLFDRNNERPPADVNEQAIKLPPVAPHHEVSRDYDRVGLSLKDHPIAFIRDPLAARHVITAADMKNSERTPHGRYAAVAGLVLFRQRPATAKGVLFMTLEDETARADLIIRPHVYERDREAAYFGRIVLARGRVQRQGKVTNLLVHRIEDISRMLADLPPMSRDFK